MTPPKGVILKTPANSAIYVVKKTGTAVAIYFGGTASEG